MNNRAKYFQLLGIAPTKNLSVIKKAYRKKAMRFHPDKNSSDEAQGKFIEITDAYEILTGQQKTPTQPSNSKTTEELRSEKIKQAKKRYKKMQQTEEEQDTAYFLKITTGWRWKSFKTFAYYTFAFTILLFVDFYTTGNTKSIPETTSYSMPHSIIYENEIFEITNDKYWAKDFPPVRMNYSFFFNDLKSVSVLDELYSTISPNRPSAYSQKFKLFDNYKSVEFHSYASVYYLFPFLQIVLLLPFFILFFKRPTINFSIGRLVSIWVVFPTILLLSFSNGRIFHLFGLI